jgi:hypothetical protein
MPVAARQSSGQLVADQLLTPTPDSQPRLQLTTAGRERHRQIRGAFNHTITQL